MNRLLYRTHFCPEVCEKEKTGGMLGLSDIPPVFAVWIT